MTAIPQARLAALPAAAKKVREPPELPVNMRPLSLALLQRQLKQYRTKWNGERAEEVRVSEDLSPIRVIDDFHELAPAGCQTQYIREGSSAPQLPNDHDTHISFATDLGRSDAFGDASMPEELQHDEAELAEINDFLLAVELSGVEDAWSDI
jgi:hypothetical protein